MVDNPTPTALQSAHAGKAYFFHNNFFHQIASNVEDKAIVEAALAMHQVTAADAEALLASNKRIASLVFDDAGKCTQAYYLPADVDEKAGPPLRDRFEGQDQFSFGADAPAAMSWVADPQGKSVLGGYPPEGFVYPEHKHPLNFQYLGFLSNADLPVPVAGDGIHLVYPMLHDDDPYKVYDISDPLAPKVLLKDDSKVLEGSRLAKAYCTSGASENPGYAGYGLYQDGDTLHYEPHRVSRQVSDVTLDHPGRASLPRWIQNPEIPICPNTGETMTFLGQFGDGTPSMESDFVERTRADEQLQNFNYSGVEPVVGFSCGAGKYGIFAFYHPKGQTMAILAQY